MSRAGGIRRGRATLVVATLLAAFCATVLLVVLAGSRAPAAAGSQSAGSTAAQTDDSVPATDVTMLGAAPEEAPDAVWGIGHGNRESARAWQMVRYADGSWSTGPEFQTDGGEPLKGFEPARSSGEAEEVALYAGAFQRSGAGVIAGYVADSHEPDGQRRMLLVRAPGGAFRETAPIPGELLDLEREALFNGRRPPLVAALDEAEGKAGALVVPVKLGSHGPEDTVLHYDGAEWTKEQIQLPAEAEAGSFRVLAIGATSGSNAWLLAQLNGESNKIGLFHRVASEGGHEWRAVEPNGSASLNVPFQGGEEALREDSVGSPPTTTTDPLTVTKEGIWIDGARSETRNAVTVYFEPNGSGGTMQASWCTVRGGEAPCTHTLSEQLPTGLYRSFAWPASGGSEPYGSRVITGLNEGASLRLEGSNFKTVLALGSSQRPNDVGVSRGAAFASATEGWLGNYYVPVHITTHPAPDKIQPYPVPFRKALTAAAPEPGAPIGAPGSRVVAVGTEGEVARYEPGVGWKPESLFNANGTIARQTLRAVAWPRAGRVYAVGERGQMWMWRAETGFWEPDPGRPPNFDGNLLGVAFDPNNSYRGYAVGQQGVLLSYGKGWIQVPACAAGQAEPAQCVPAPAVGASFTSIAFAGSEALVAFRKYHPPKNGKAPYYTGGLLENSGSGWRIDAAAEQALGSAIPYAVGALPDGGAAISATGDGLTAEQGGRTAILERETGGGAWQEAAAQYPGYDAPGSLALFREDGHVRIVGAGAVPNTLAKDEVPEPPEGFPEALVEPYPLTSGHVLRQTATGWSDEEHDYNPVLAPDANYRSYDMVYSGDKTAAVLLNGAGTEGWTVGGEIDLSNPNGDTSDIGRYPAETNAPAGVSAAPVPTSSTDAIVAIGGGGQCAAPCALRAQAGVGPDVWLSHAVSLASQTRGVRAFIDVGPRISTGETTGQPSGIALQGVPYQRESERYAQLLGGTSLPAFAAATASEADGEGSQCAFTSAFSEFSAPFGEGPEPAGIKAVSRSSQSCSSGESNYYSFETQAGSGVGGGKGGPLRVIVLDDSHEGEIESAQMLWLSQQLSAARGAGVPVIVAGHPFLQEQIAHGSIAASELARTIVQGGASAYFFDSPEENIQLPLRVGSASIPSFGSGTLGYVSLVASATTDFHGHSGFLLAQVEDAARNAATNRAPVTVQLVPNVGELALEAKDGLIIRRSRPALFNGLARLPRSGGVAQGDQQSSEATQYIPLPANCVGSACAQAILPSYEFVSSHPDVGSFVAPNLASGDPRSVLLNSSEETIPDSSSGLFCAFNAGRTDVTIRSGGLAASLEVTVLAGSVRRPCGSVKNTEHVQTAIKPQEVTQPPAESSPPLSFTLPPAPLVATPAVPVPPTPRVPAGFVPFATPSTVPLSIVVPPPLPAAGQPTPPSGTSPVSQPVAQNEEEEEEATESVGNQAVAYRPEENEPQSLFVIGLIVLAALAGTGAARGRGRRGRRHARIAPATITAQRRQAAEERALRRRM